MMQCQKPTSAFHKTTTLRTSEFKLRSSDLERSWDVVKGMGRTSGEDSWNHRVSVNFNGGNQQKSKAEEVVWHCQSSIRSTYPSHIWEPSSMFVVAGSVFWLKGWYCWWFRNPKQPPFGCIKHCKSWEATTFLNWCRPDFWNIKSIFQMFDTLSHRFDVW